MQCSVIQQAFCKQQYSVNHCLYEMRMLNIINPQITLTIHNTLYVISIDDMIHFRLI